VSSSVGADAAAATVRFHAAGQAEVPDGDDWLTPPEAERLNAMRYTKRRDEARLGRWTAKHAVARALDRSLAHTALRDVVIRNASDGAPEAFVGDEPAGVAISMTDRAGWGVCTVAGGGAALGCDLELVEPRSDLFVADYFTAAERATVAASPEEHDLLANLIWSAKESALKVLREGLRLDTRSVEVTLLDGADAAWRAMTVATDAGEQFRGWWRRFGDFVMTACATTATAAPIALVSPSPLEGAVPAHSWMAEPLRGRGQAPSSIDLD
jgi:4'-phosphopantetheinyl transferase